MPLLPDARLILHASLDQLSKQQRPLVVTIGYLTDAQHLAISKYRLQHKLPELVSPEVLFLGRHLFESRVIKDRYSHEDVIDQIEAAMADTSIVIATHKMTAVRSAAPRMDRYGNMVVDEAVFELTQRRPRAELYSVIPKGDRIKPP